MKRFTALLFLIAMPAGMLHAKVELPEWDAPEEAGNYALGGGLWPKKLLPEPGAAPELETPAVVALAPDFVGPPAPGETVAATATATATAATTVAAATATTPPGEPSAPTQFFGPEGLPEDATDASLQRVRENPDGTFSIPEEIVEEVAYEPLPPLEGELADLYFAHPPVEFLIDPQRLLTEQKSNDIMRFLEFHSDESPIRIHVMVLGENQKVPAEIDLAALHAKWFSDTPAVVMLYYREQPQLTQLVFNRSIEESLPESVFDRILENTLREGAVADLAPDQVEKMAIELSIQLYWLSRLMDQERKGDQSLESASSIHEMMASADAPELLREYAPGIFIEENGKALTLVFTIVFILGGLAVVGCVAWVVMWWRGRENVSGEPLLFPDFRIARRLGGEYCGGGFVSMSFELNEGA